MRFSAGLIYGVCCLFSTILYAADALVVYPVAGNPFAGRVSSIDQDWNITIDAESKRQVLTAGELALWGAQIDRESGPQIVLADGGLLIAEFLTIRDETLEFETRHFGPVKLPLKFVRGIVFQPPVDLLERDRLLERIATARGQEDLLLLANGDVLGGSLITKPDEAAATNVDKAPLRLETGTRQVEVPQDRVTALIFNPALVEPPKPQGMTVRIGLRDGSCLTAQKIVRGKDGLEIVLPGGVKLPTLPGLVAEEFFGDLTLVQPRSDQVTYVSDLTPIGEKHVPYLTTKWRHQADRSVVGGRLRWRNQIYAKGVGMHSRSRLAYELNGAYQSFRSELALDRQAGKLGSVTYRVYLQDKDGEWNLAYTSPVIRGGVEPVHMNVDVKDAKRMAQIVDWADRGDTMDHANWLNARLTK